MSGLLCLALALGSSGAYANDLPVGDPTLDPPDAPEPQVEPEEDEPPKFYDEDIPSTSESVIFVVDRSSSMTLPVSPFVGLDGGTVTDGTRLDFVKTELTKSIRSLPPTFTFNIVIYSECVESWQPQRVQATSAMKSVAVSWVQAIEPWGWTNTGGAAATALSDHENQLVMLLSDGAPNFLDCSQTYIGDFERHKQVIRTSNSQKATIHCFGIGLDPETRQFMMQVAQENAGSFKELD